MRSLMTGNLVRSGSHLPFTTGGGAVEDPADAFESFGDEIDDRLVPLRGIVQRNRLSQGEAVGETVRIAPPTADIGGRDSQRMCRCWR